MRLLALTALFSLLFSSTARADQLRHEVEKQRPAWTLETRWTDADGERHEVSYRLPAATVREDLQEPLRFKKKEAMRYAAQEVNAYGKTVRGVRIKATVSRDGELQINASGNASKLRDAMSGAKEVRDAAFEEYLEQNGYAYFKRNTIIPDHARHVAEYADDLAPLVRALGGPTEDPREFADLALSFVQSVPYEQRAKISDRYRRPLSVLGRNKGDCDSKTVLFLAMMRQAYPEMALGIVYIKGHAYGAIGLEPQRGDVKLRRHGRKWVGVEPVGPAMREAGSLGGKSRRRARLGWYRMIEVEI